jgi:ribosomal protein L11 methyltransferase
MFELSLMCPEDRIEAVSDALDALDALSVSVEDADAQTDAEQALFGEPGMPPPKEGWQRSRVVACLKPKPPRARRSNCWPCRISSRGARCWGWRRYPSRTGCD